MEKSPSGFVKDKGQSRLSLMVSAEIPRLRTTKSLPDQIVSRYSSGVAEPGLIKNSGMKMLYNSIKESFTFVSFK